MNFRTRPHFEDRQIVQYNDESINLSGTTIISPTVLDFTGATTGQTTVDISGLVGYLNEGREYGFRMEPPLLKISGSTGYTTVDVTGYVLTSVDEYGNVGWQPMSGGTSGGTDTYVTGGTLNGSYQLTLGRNDGSSTSPIDLSALSDSTYWTSGSSGNYSVKVVNGGTTDATNDYAVASGFNTLASGLWSTSQNIGTTASGQSSHAEGEDTVASGDYGSHAEGYQTIASGQSSHAEGNQTIASGDNSHAGGDSSSASGVSSFIHSTNSTVTGDRSVVLGGQNNLISGHTDSFIIGGTGNTIHFDLIDNFTGNTYEGIMVSTDSLIKDSSTSLVSNSRSVSMYNQASSSIIGSSSVDGGNLSINPTYYGDTVSEFGGGGNTHYRFFCSIR